MLLPLIKAGYITTNTFMLCVSGLRIFLPIYFRYGNFVVKSLNYDRHFDLPAYWMFVLVPWDIILAISGIRAILRNDREQIFENAFKLSVFGLVVIWFINGLGDRFQNIALYLLKSRMKHYHTDLRAKKVVDAVQLKFKCCGFNDIFIWKTEATIPDSCCVNNTCINGSVYAFGCAHHFGEYIETMNLWILFVNFPFIELLISVWNCLLTDQLPGPDVMYELADEENIVNAPASTDTECVECNTVVDSSERDNETLSPTAKDNLFKLSPSLISDSSGHLQSSPTAFVGSQPCQSMTSIRTSPNPQSQNDSSPP